MFSLPPYGLAVLSLYFFLRFHNHFFIPLYFFYIISASASDSISYPSPSFSPPLRLTTIKYDYWIRPFEMSVTPCMVLVTLKNDLNHIFRLANEPFSVPLWILFFWFWSISMCDSSSILPNKCRLPRQPLPNHPLFATYTFL